MSDHSNFVMFPLAVIHTILPIFGITGNCIMVIATFKAKRMNSPCHILIALTCASDLVNELGQIPFVFHFFNDCKLSEMFDSSRLWLRRFRNAESSRFGYQHANSTSLLLSNNLLTTRQTNYRLMCGWLTASVINTVSHALTDDPDILMITSLRVNEFIDNEFMCKNSSEYFTSLKCFCLLYNQISYPILYDKNSH
ncbi:hypothetical protein DICVIV_04919 [Dictyocaulus viviparus]|uniref:G-protein coupled receptors family 1 profile domain-containing protein n=1 Tax=Dictyocaulus viviparus TaxID=29172 RepID=A0A0D8XYW3_DICVI|nr:hypothetical protein DICVIV_04919 [Dictyocaulus viviparus]